MPRLARMGKGPVPSTTMMTLREVATYLRLHRSTVYRLAREGDIPGFKVGTQWRFNSERLGRWMVGQKAGFAGPERKEP